MHEPSLINTLGAFIFTFIPYLLLWQIIQLTGGVVGRGVGIARQFGQKVDVSKNFRKGERGNRLRRWQEGTLFSPDSKLTRMTGGGIVNRVGAHVGSASGASGWRLGFGDVGAVKRANAAFTDSQTYAKEDRDFAAQINNEEAMLSVAFGNNESALRRLHYFKQKDANGNVLKDSAGNDLVNEQKVQNALSTGRSIRVTARSKTAATDALARSGKIIENRQEADMLFDAASDNNAALRAAVVGSTRYTWRQIGRNDVGRETDYEALQEMNMSQVSQLKPIGAKNLIPAIARVAPSGVDPDTGKEISLTERQHMVDLLYAAQFNPYSNAYQQEAVNKAVRGVMANSEDMWRQAQQNYRSKLGGAGSGEPGGSMADTYGVGGIPATPPPPPPPYEPRRDNRGGHEGYL